MSHQPSAQEAQFDSFCYFPTAIFLSTQGIN